MQALTNEGAANQPISAARKPTSTPARSYTPVAVLSASSLSWGYGNGVDRSRLCRLPIIPLRR